jgi:hypothetical protein
VGIAGLSALLLIAVAIPEADRPAEVNTALMRWTFSQAHKAWRDTTQLSCAFSTF